MESDYGKSVDTDPANNQGSSHWIMDQFGYIGRVIEDDAQDYFQAAQNGGAPSLTKLEALEKIVLGLRKMVKNSKLHQEAWAEEKQPTPFLTDQLGGQDSQKELNNQQAGYDIILTKLESIKAGVAKDGGEEYMKTKLVDMMNFLIMN